MNQIVNHFIDSIRTKFKNDLTCSENNEYECSILKRNVLRDNQKEISQLHEAIFELNASIECTISSLVRAEVSSIPSCERFETALLKCEIILDLCWERINCGKWSSVSVSTRQVYAYHQLLKSILILCQVSSCSMHESLLVRLVSSLNCLDRGLVMSPDLSEDQLVARCASFLHQAIVEFVSSSIIETDCDIRLKWNKIIENIKNVKRQRISDIEIPFYSLSHQRDVLSVDCIDFAEFEQSFFRPRVPVIIKNVTQDWPCMSTRRWTLESILRDCAFRLVPIEIGSKYTDDNWSQKLMLIIDFVDEHILNRSSRNSVAYLAQHNLFNQIIDLAQDFTLPDYCASLEDDLSNEDDECDVEVNAWFGPAGTVSPLHTDAKHNMFVQVMGSKYVRLYSHNTPCDQIYPYQNTQLMSNTSRIDLEHLDRVSYPRFSEIDPSLVWECVLNEGEMLYIPKTCWHFVKSLSTSFSLSFWWK